MKKNYSIILIFFFITGCATITPPPNRISWDDMRSSTECTDDDSSIKLQYAGSLVAAGLGGWELGTSLALGTSPVLGITLAGIGIYGGSDADKKFKQVEKCKEFKQYLLLRDRKNNNIKDMSLREKLNQLKDLFKNGDISEKEYDSLRKKTLNNL